jgi:hypothetical protein
MNMTSALLVRCTIVDGCTCVGRRRMMRLCEEDGNEMEEGVEGCVFIGAATLDHDGGVCWIMISSRVCWS